MLLETEFAIPANSSFFVHFGEFCCSFLELFFGTIICSIFLPNYFVL
jgi:hypothetical protein